MVLLESIVEVLITVVDDVIAKVLLANPLLHARFREESTLLLCSVRGFASSTLASRHDRGLKSSIRLTQMFSTAEALFISLVLRKPDQTFSVGRVPSPFTAVNTNAPYLSTHSPREHGRSSRNWYQKLLSGTTFLLRVSIAGIERKDKRGGSTDTNAWFSR
jgi:hypothetical protein